jgi:hypothetical protein
VWGGGAVGEWSDGSSTSVKDVVVIQEDGGGGLYPCCLQGVLWRHWAMLAGCFVDGLAELRLTSPYSTPPT